MENETVLRLNFKILYGLGCIWIADRWSKYIVITSLCVMARIYIYIYIYMLSLFSLLGGKYALIVTHTYICIYMKQSIHVFSFLVWTALSLRERRSLVECSARCAFCTLFMLGLCATDWKTGIMLLSFWAPCQGHELTVCILIVEASAWELGYNFTACILVVDALGIVLGHKPLVFVFWW